MRTRLATLLLSVALAAAGAAEDDPAAKTTADAPAAPVRADAELVAAARRGDLPAIAARLQKGAAVDAAAPSGETALIAAAVNGRVDATRALIDAGAELSAPQRGWGTPLDAAERAGQDEVAAVLRQAGARSGSGRSVGDTVCVRPWNGDGYCGTVEAASRASYVVRITEIVGCGDGCAPRAECSAGARVGGRDGLGVGDTVATVSWCLTHTGVVP
jgi:hypothetical protein